MTFMELLQKQEVTTKDLSHAMNIDQHIFGDWGRGYGEPTPEQIKQLAYYLGVEKAEVYDSFVYATEYRDREKLRLKEKHRRKKAELNTLIGE